MAASTKCNNCEINAAEITCEQCHSELCNNCSQTIHQHKIMQKHTLKKINVPPKVPPKPTFDKAAAKDEIYKPLCQKHKKTIINVCKDDELLLCIQCQDEEHQGHQTVSLLSATKAASKTIKSQLQKMQDDLIQLQDLQKDISGEENLLSEKTSQIKCDMMTRKQKLCDTIDKIAQNLLMMADKETSTGKETLTATVNQIVDQIQKTEAAIMDANATVVKGSPEEILNLRKHLQHVTADFAEEYQAIVNKSSEMKHLAENLESNFYASVVAMMNSDTGDSTQFDHKYLTGMLTGVTCTTEDSKVPDYENTELLEKAQHGNYANVEDGNKGSINAKEEDEEDQDEDYIHMFNLETVKEMQEASLKRMSQALDLDVYENTNLRPKLLLDRHAVDYTELLHKTDCREVWVGTVYGMPATINVLNINSVDEQQLHSQATELASFQHPHLATMLTCLEGEPYFVATEHFPQGSLLDFMAEDMGETLGLRLLLQIASQIAAGMAYLEEIHFAHGYLKSTNVFILTSDPDHFKVKVELCPWKKAAKDFTPPIRWAAPEVIKYGKKGISSMSDVWSFAVVMVEMATLGKLPYEGMTEMEVLQKVQEGYHLPIPHNEHYEFPQEIYEELLKCWSLEPSQRPKFEFLHTYTEDMFHITPEDYLRPTDWVQSSKQIHYV
ncbi:tyrosine-protein kinase Fer isoform X2 [Lingula anatina]|nr:tyrosine-protein kinase Fer isoform X2 [Lingula anatina]XP_013385542.2 tyrosine-protein kinase Fer isoform X2 [Lingula anatina]|eukprot:XP_013385541.2 tyrosine-protein kinase Fer isoform X2 [Lingula anatina]